MSNPKAGTHEQRFQQQRFTYETTYQNAKQVIESDNKAKELHNTDDLSEAINWAAEVRDDIANRLQAGESQLVLARSRLNQLQADKQRLRQAQEQGRILADDQELSALSERVEDQKSKVFAAFEKIFAEEIQNIVNAKPTQPTTFTPNDHGQRMTLSKLAKALNQTDYGEAWPAEAIFNALYPAFEGKASAEGDVARLSKELQDMTFDRDRYQEAVRKDEIKSESERKAYEDAKAGFERTIATKDQEVKAAQDELNDMRGHYEELYGSADQAEKDLKKTLVEKQEELESRQKTIAGLKRDLNNRNLKIDSLKEALEAERRAREQQQQERIGDAQAMRDDNIKKFRQIEERLQKSDQRCEELSTALTARDDEKQQLRKEILHTMYSILLEMVNPGENSLTPETLFGSLLDMMKITSLKPRLVFPNGYDHGKGQYPRLAEMSSVGGNPWSDKSEFAVILLHHFSSLIGKPSPAAQGLLAQLAFMDRRVVFAMLYKEAMHRADPQAPPLSDIDQMRLSFIWPVLMTQLRQAQGDPLAYAWASCLVVDMMYARDVATEEIEQLVIIHSQDLPMLRAAGLLRLKMALRHLKSNAELESISASNLDTEDSDDDDVASADVSAFEDSRFKPKILEQTSLSVKTMPDFLKAVSKQTSIVGGSKTDEWYIITDNIIAVANDGTASMWYFWTQYQLQTWSLSQEAPFLITFDGASLRISWQVSLTGNRYRHYDVHQDSDLYKYMLTFHHDDVLRALENYHSRASVQTEEEKRLQEELAALEEMNAQGERRLARQT